MSKVVGTQNIDYFNTRALSNSLMSIYCDDFYEFTSYWVFKNKLKSLDTEQLKFGSLADTLLTAKDEFDSRYQVYDKKVPTGQMLKFCNALVNTVDMNFDIAYSVVEAQNDGKLRDNLDKFKDKFREFEEYYRILKDSTKTVISTDFLKRAEKMVAEARTNPRTRLLINTESLGNIQVFYQVEIFITINGIPCKCAIDKLIVDHSKRRILIIDYKTSMKAVNFHESVIEYNYYRQGSFYTELLRYWMIDNNLQDYEIMDFLFVVMSSIKSNHHFVYRLSKDDIQIAREGGYLYNGAYVKGWEEIINEISELTKLGDWSYPWEIAKSPIIELDIFKKNNE